MEPLESVDPPVAVDTPGAVDTPVAVDTPGSVDPPVAVGTPGVVDAMLHIDRLWYTSLFLDCSKTTYASLQNTPVASGHMTVVPVE